MSLVIGVIDNFTTRFCLDFQLKEGRTYWLLSGVKQAADTFFHALIYIAKLIRDLAIACFDRQQVSVPHRLEFTEDQIKGKAAVEATQKDRVADSIDLQSWKKEMNDLRSMHLTQDALKATYRRLFTVADERGWLNEVYGRLNRTVLFDVAIWSCLRELVPTLVNKIDPCIRERAENRDPGPGSGEGNSAFMWAIASANNETALMMLDLTINRSYLNIQDSNRKNCALHLIVGKGYKNISYHDEHLTVSNLQLLNKMINLNCNLNLQNEDGNTPLHLACARRDFDMIKALLDAGADRTIQNNQGKTPQQMLSMTYEEARVLISHTVSPAFLLDSNEHANQLEACQKYFG